MIRTAAVLALAATLTGLGATTANAGTKWTHPAQTAPAGRTWA
jgi:hypothetical protein